MVSEAEIQRIQREGLAAIPLGRPKKAVPTQAESRRDEG